MGLQIGVLLTYAGAIIVIFIIGKMFLWPIKMIFRLVASSLLAGFCIVLVNTLFAGAGLFIPLNMPNALTAGILGIPGFVTLLLLNFF